MINKISGSRNFLKIRKAKPQVTGSYESIGKWQESLRKEAGYSQNRSSYLLDYWTPPQPKSPFGEHLAWDTSIFILHPFSDTPFPDVSQFSNRCLSKSLWSSRQSVDYGPWISEQLHIWPFLQLTAQCSAHCDSFPSPVSSGFSQKGVVMSQLSTSVWCLNNTKNHQ